MNPDLPADPLGLAPSPGRPARSGCATVLLGLVGFVLLMPGVCVLAIAALSSAQGTLPSFGDLVGLLPFVSVIAILFVGGFLMIRAAFRG